MSCSCRKPCLSRFDFLYLTAKSVDQKLELDTALHLIRSIIKGMQTQGPSILKQRITPIICILSPEEGERRKCSLDLKLENPQEYYILASPSNNIAPA